MQTKIQNAYISVKLKSKMLKVLQSGLIENLQETGVEAEEASAAAHVSIAYGEGEVDRTELVSLLTSIARIGFKVRATGFEFFEGRTTDYDYLVVTLESSGDYGQAVALAQNQMAIRSFENGFKSHVSLLRFKKGSCDFERLDRVIRELNASHGAAFALGQCICVEGECVCVFNPDREIYLEVPIDSRLAA